MDSFQVISCPSCGENIIVVDEDIFCDVCVREFRLEDGKFVELPVTSCERS
jgi:hypothetical protein